MTLTAVQAAEERCPRSDLYPSMCGHCRGHTGPSLILVDIDIVRRWRTRRPGRCGWCGAPYKAGDEIGRDESDERVCWRCLP